MGDHVSVDLAALRPDLTEETGLVEARQRGDARGVGVPFAPGGVPAARRAVLRDISGKLDDSLVHEAAVVVSELLGNSVRHARPLEDGRLLLRWQVRGGVLDVEVTDGGSSTVVRAMRPPPLSTGGRGLRIVRYLAHEWGVVEEEGRRTVWASLGGPSRRRRRAV
jgi:anti-sigma regulatory factor (Ser/Thr protein kinase)